MRGFLIVCLIVATIGANVWAARRRSVEFIRIRSELAACRDSLQVARGSGTRWVKVRAGSFEGSANVGAVPLDALISKVYLFQAGRQTVYCSTKIAPLDSVWIMDEVVPSRP